MQARTILIGAALVAYAALATALQPRSWQVNAAVLVPVAAVAVLALRRRQPQEQDPPATRRAIVLWSVLLGAGLLWEAWAFFHQPAWNIASHDYPTLSALLEPHLDNLVFRFGTWTVWLYAGFRLVRR